MPKTEPEPYLTLEQMANVLHLNPRTVLAMVEDGDIPALKTRRKWLFDRDDVKEHLQYKKTKAQQETECREKSLEEDREIIEEIAKNL